MELRADQLVSHLQQPRLAPIYLLSSDETLLRDEAADQLRAAAQAQGYGERQRLYVDALFQWPQLISATASRSLFSERRLVELHLSSVKPGQEGSRVLQRYAEQPASDTLLLILAPKLERDTLKAKWLQALREKGVLIRFWSPDAEKLPGWIRQRLAQHAIDLTPDAAALLAHQVEGNLLLAANEIARLRLLYQPAAGAPPYRLDLAQIAAEVSDSARFDLFELSPAILSGDAARALRILQRLRAEGSAPALILWALARDLRQLISLTAAVAGGMALPSALQQCQQQLPPPKPPPAIWERQRQLLTSALRRQPQVAVWQQGLRLASEIDRLIKGGGAALVWPELIRLTLLMAAATKPQPMRSFDGY